MAWEHLIQSPDILVGIWACGNVYMRFETTPSLGNVGKTMKSQRNLKFVSCFVGGERGGWGG